MLLLHIMQNTHLNLAYEAAGMLLSFLYNYLATFPHFPFLTYQTEPPKLQPNPYASVKYIEFEKKKVSFILSQPTLVPSCRDQQLLGLSETSRGAGNSHYFKLASQGGFPKQYTGPRMF